MIDRCKISLLRQIPLKPSVTTCPRDSRIFALFPHLNVCTRSGAGNEGVMRCHHVINPRPDGAITLLAVSDDWESQPFLYAIELNLARLLYGHNGFPITTAIELAAALHEVEEIVRLFLPDKQNAVRVIPGVADSHAAWSMIELFSQHHDPDGMLMRLFSGASHPGTRAKQFVVPGESIKLCGTHHWLSIYRKDLEMVKLSKKFNVDPRSLPRIIRIEHRLKGRILKRCLGRESKDVTSFTFDKLEEVHRMLTRQIKNVFFRGPAGSGSDVRANRKVSKILRFAYGVLREKGGTVQEYVRIHKESTSSSSATASRFKNGLRFLVEQSSTLSVDELLPEDVYIDPPYIRIPNLEEEAWSARFSAGFDSEIHRVYGRLTKKRPFRPRVLV